MASVAGFVGCTRRFFVESYVKKSSKWPVFAKTLWF